MQSLFKKSRYFITLVYEALVIRDKTKRVHFVTGAIRLPTNHRQHTSADGTLVIENVQEGVDEGEYTCIARNPQGQGTRSRVVVTVKGKRQNIYLTLNLYRMNVLIGLG